MPRSRPVEATHGPPHSSTPGGLGNLVDGAVLQVDGDGNLRLVALTCEPAQLREYVMGSAGGDPVLLAVYELHELLINCRLVN